jgi:hypothetical protein
MAYRRRQADLPPAYAPVCEFANRALPGSSERIRRFRQQLLDFAFTPIARSIFITRAAGAGSEIARLAALLRAIAPLTEDAAVRRLESVKLFPGEPIDLRSLAGWFAEIDATGRSETDAAEELLGRIGGPSGDPPPHPGVFERAILLGGRRAPASVLTGGIVYIAEPADLAPAIQARVAGICAGLPFERLGLSEEDETFLAFEGVFISSTWRDNGCDGLRPDLARHLAQREVSVPRLSERPEDFEVILDIATARVRREYRAFVERAERHGDVAREYWRTHSLPARLPANIRALLAQVDWSRHGEAGGLVDCIRNILVGKSDPEQVLAGLAISAPLVVDHTADALIEQLEALGALDGTGLASALRTIEVQNRLELHDRLKSDRATLARLASTLMIDSDRLLTQVYQIGRRRLAGSGRKSA